MFKQLLLASLICSSAVYADTDAQQQSSPVTDMASASIPANMYELEHKKSAQVDPKYTNQQKQTLNKVNEYKQNQKKNFSNVNGKGEVIFIFGQQQANVVCSILNITDIELEPGEIVNSVNIGDASRWSVEGATSGSGETLTSHIILKPFDIGLRTNLVISTDRRIYHIDIMSTDNSYYPHVKFSYPEKLLAEFNARQLVIQQERAKQSITVENDEPKTYLGDLNFKYSIEGNVSWKPTRVYDDGSKTIIELPTEVKYVKAPALLIMSNSQTEIINYRLQGKRYIVDGIFDTAILTLGLDKNQQRVIIKREK